MNTLFETSTNRAVRGEGGRGNFSVCELCHQVGKVDICGRTQLSQLLRNVQVPLQGPLFGGGGLGFEVWGLEFRGYAFWVADGVEGLGFRV